jgi:hypothetical protein
MKKYPPTSSLSDTEIRKIFIPEKPAEYLEVVRLEYKIGPETLLAFFETAGDKGTSIDVSVTNRQGDPILVKHASKETLATLNAFIDKLKEASINVNIDQSKLDINEAQPYNHTNHAHAPYVVISDLNRQSVAQVAKEFGFTESFVTKRNAQRELTGNIHQGR